ncbi:cytochrome c oxidase assembly protein [Microbacterium sp. P05]|uniref:cytochrome c oxidase assembly protein n=1 Tax=Microbacterium sp. P05 TaxID=3366948 RepID=UPI0037450E38
MTHPHSATASLDGVILALAGLAVALYLGGVLISRGRRSWPVQRSVLWLAGTAAATASVVGPLADAAHEDFVAHMATHLLGGMIAPLLLVLAAPVTLALRTLAIVPARRVSRILRSRPARLISHPVTALLLSAGGLWLIYLTPVFAAMRTDPLMHLIVHAHLLAAGALFTAAVIGIDPHPHRAGRPLLAAAIVAGSASHSILAKYLFAHPPVGVSASAAAEGAQLMYYAGATIEGVVILIFCAQWYRAAGRRLARTPSAVAV